MIATNKTPEWLATVRRNRMIQDYEHNATVYKEAQRELKENREQQKGFFFTYFLQV